MHLVEIEQENSDLKTRLEVSEAGNTGKDSEITKLRRRLQMLEKQNESLQNANAVYEQERRGLEREVCMMHCSSILRYFLLKRCIFVALHEKHFFYF